MTKSFFTADPHLDHQFLIKAGMRPFSSVEVWNEFFLDLVNSRVKRNNILWILGDFSWGKPEYWRKQIKCKDVRLILGNHDKPNEITKAGFSQVHEQRTISIKGISTFLSHYPTFFWNKSHYGSFSLYGHVHSQRQAFIENICPGIRALDVSPDNYARAFGTWDIFDDDLIYDMLSKRSGHDSVDWYREYQKENWTDRPLVK